MAWEGGSGWMRRRGELRERAAALFAESYGPNGVEAEVEVRHDFRGEYLQRAGAQGAPLGQEVACPGDGPVRPGPGRVCALVGTTEGGIVRAVPAPGLVLSGAFNSLVAPGPELFRSLSEARPIFR